MFTGIVEELGHVHAIVPNEGGARIEIDAKRVARGREHRRFDRGQRVLPDRRRVLADRWAADVVTETLARRASATSAPAIRSTSNGRFASPIASEAISSKATSTAPASSVTARPTPTAR